MEVNMPLLIVHDDITKLEVDAIVNAANRELSMGGGVCGAIFRAAGPSQMQAACDALSPIKTGEAVRTPGFNLPAKNVIHTAGPIYDEYQRSESKKHLSDAYLNSLEIAKVEGYESIAFPLISSGIYGYPKAEALEVATRSIKSFLEEHDLDVFLVIHDRDTFEISKSLEEEVSEYIDNRLNIMPVSEEITRFEYEKYLESYTVQSIEIDRAPTRKSESKDLDEVLSQLDDSFSTTLLKLIDSKSMTDVEVYKRANIDRRLFSKIRSDENYSPSKRTAIALSIALKLNLKETNKLLELAGFALSPSCIFDVIIEYFIINEKYDIFDINEVLFKYEQPLLGS